MSSALRIALLGAGVAGAVARPRRLPSWAAPVACVLVALLAGAVSIGQISHALRPLAGPLGFLLAAIPLAVLLDQYGYFEHLAALFGSGPRLVLGLWVLAAATVAVLNLDAAVVLLTPLAVRIARRQHLPPRHLGFQPVLLALLASSFLPVSNLTNLIAASRAGLTTGALLEHLGLPGLVACIVGYACYRRSEVVTAVDDAADATDDPGHAAADEPYAPADRRRVLIVGSGVVVFVLAGFVGGATVGLQDWEVALAADVFLVALTRSAPVRSIPWGTALVAAGLAVLADVAVRGHSLGGLLTATGPLGTLRAAGVSALGANVVNNLPAFLVALPSVSRSGTGSCALWPVLLGVNAGPSLLVTGSLASLLWMESMRRLGAAVTPRQYFAMGIRVGLPAAIAAVAVLLALAPVVGCG